MNAITRWGDKPYYSLNYYLKKTYGRKIYKLSLNGGMSCPNRDGTIDTRGCIFCSLGGSGDFSAPPNLSIHEQIEEAKKLVRHKMSSQGNNKDSNVTKDSYDVKDSCDVKDNCDTNDGCDSRDGCDSKDNFDANGKGEYIAYFQAYTNTHGDISHLRSIFTQAVLHPDIVALSIATRPDCLGPEVLELLAELNSIKPVWVELGLQTCHEKTALFIRRGYPLSVFEEAVKNLNKLDLTIIVHIIIGLPGESTADILESITYVTAFPIQGIKLQLLHILKGTDLTSYSFPVLSLEEYVAIIISCLEFIPKNIVIHRVTGDGPKNLLIAPLWSSNKKSVLNLIHKEFKKRETWQGQKLEAPIWPEGSFNQSLDKSYK